MFALYNIAIHSIYKNWNNDINRQYFYDKCGFYKLWNSLKQFFFSLQHRKTLCGLNWILLFEQTAHYPLSFLYITQWAPIFWSLIESGTLYDPFLCFLVEPWLGVESGLLTFSYLLKLIRVEQYCKEILMILWRVQ